MKLDLEAIGMTKQELQTRVVDRICGRILESTGCDEDGYEGESAFAKKMAKAVQERIDAAVEKIADTHVLPSIAAHIEALTLQETNKWGEKSGKPITFVEYLIQRAGEYMTEEVNFEGKTKTENRGYSWVKSQTRVAHMIHQHLHYNIESAMKDALLNVNGKIVQGLAETCRIKLKEIMDGLKVEVHPKR
jgi:hypothetical protein